MTHYVILHDYAVEDSHGLSAGGIEITAVAHSHEAAVEKLSSASAGERQYAKEHGWEVFEDTPDAFDAGEEGNYVSEHSHFYIEEIDGEYETVASSEILDKIRKIENATLEHYRGNITRARYESDIDTIRKVISDLIARTEPSDTDFILVKKLAEVFEPSIRGIITAEEKALVTNALELGCRNVRELRNLRNTFVMVSDMSTKSIDYISAVTCVIDEAIFNRGGEV